LNRRFKRGRLPSTSGASGMDAHNSATWVGNRGDRVGSENL